jgi:tripartite-type tricarboxylate transporter receptor subunit TctC
MAVRKDGEATMRSGPVWLAALIAGGAVASPHAIAQPFPAKPIRIVIPFSSGSTADILSRTIGIKLTEAWGQQIVVESRAGAAGSIAASHVARAPADGYTLLMGGASTLGTNGLLYRKLPYDPVRDLVPVIQVIRSPSLLIVHPSLPVRSVKELVALGRAKPGALAYSSSGNGTPSHLGIELLDLMAGIKTVHVPYRGASEALTDLRGGQVQFALNAIVSSMPHIQSGHLRPIAVTGSRRSEELPNVATVAETLPGYELYLWFGLAAPAGTPAEVVAKLNAEIGRVLQLPDVRSRFIGLGAEVAGGPPDAFAQYIKAELAKWSKVISRLDLRLD